ncbi:MAG: hypothetical protein AB7R69_01145 [Candidatus Babeliales bacterium]
MIKRKTLYVWLALLGGMAFLQAIPQYYCTACDAKYFSKLLNLIGSLHATNYDNINEIAVFDLGLEEQQISFLKTIQNIAVYNVELTHPDLLRQVVINKAGRMVPGWFAWKPVVIKQALERFPYVLWIDAGSTVLRPLDDLFEYIQHKGYFLATIGNERDNGKFRHPIAWQTTRYVRNKFNLDAPEYQWILSQEAVMAGVIGVAQKAQDLFITPLYNMSKDLRNFIDDGTAPEGFGCARYEQALLGILAYLKDLCIHKQDYTQKVPMLLDYNQVSIPFYITWQGDFVNENTHIYSSRNDIKNFQWYLKQIRKCV